jgi:hypothetical protein
MTAGWRRPTAAVMALAAGLAPRAAAACAACVSAASGDRGFNWGYGGLLIAPFLVLVVIGSVLGWSAGYRLRWQRAAPSRVIGPIPANEETS